MKFNYVLLGLILLLSCRNELSQKKQLQPGGTWGNIGINPNENLKVNKDSCKHFYYSDSLGSVGITPKGWQPKQKLHIKGSWKREEN